MAARSRGKEGESGFSSPSPSPRRSIARRRYRSSQTITAAAVIPCLSPTSQGSSSSSAAFIYSSPPSQPCFFVLDPPPPPPWSNRSLLLSRYLRPPTGGYICYPPQYIVLCPEEERGERALITDLLSHIFPYRNYSLEAFPSPCQFVTLAAASGEERGRREKVTGERQTGKEQGKMGSMEENK